MQVLAVCNQKGGVGKTTTVINLGRAAVQDGRRVLMVDMDAQANLSASMTAEQLAEDTISVADVLSARTDVTATDAIVSGVWDQLRVLPSSEALATVQEELVIAGGGREFRLREALASVASEFDLILIDCAPSLDLLAINALTAADSAVVVAHASLYSTNGIARLLRTIETVGQYYNPGLRIGGVIANSVDQRTVNHRRWLDELRGFFGSQLLEPPIPKRTLIGEAGEAGTGLDEVSDVDVRYFASVYRDYLTQLEAIPV